MNRFYLILINLLIITSSCQKGVNQSINQRIDSLERNTTILENEIVNIKKENPFVGITEIDCENCKIILFRPCGLDICLCSKRPDFSCMNYLCVPCAYTTTRNSIDGLFIENGMVINEQNNNKLTGSCIIAKGTIHILSKNEMDSSIVNNVINSGESLFQQTLLVRNGKIIHCDLFKNIKSKRRALIKFENEFCICESDKSVTINEFQNALLYAGVKNAVNLDMGSWSYGWYRSKCCDKVEIYDNRTNTDRQTNWPVYVDDY